MWSNYGKTFIEYIFLKRFRDKDFHINIKGKNILEEIKRVKDQLYLCQVILLISNLCQWKSQKKN